MNLRQKAKHYKRLAELYGAKTIQSNISYQRFETKHLRCIRHYNPNIQDVSVEILLCEDRLLESVKPLIASKVIDDEILSGKRIESDIWIVDRH